METLISSYLIKVKWCSCYLTVLCWGQWDFNAMKAQSSQLQYAAARLLTYRECAACSILQAAVSSPHCSIVGLMLNHLLSGAAGGHQFLQTRHTRDSSWCWCQNPGRKIKYSQLPAVQTKYNRGGCTFWSFQRWLLAAMPMAYGLLSMLTLITFKIFILLSLIYFYPLLH